MLSTEPQTVGGILDSGFRIYRTTLRAVFAPAVVFALLLAALGLVLGSAVDFEALADGNLDGALPTLFWVLLPMDILLLLMFFLVMAQRQWHFLQGHQLPLTTDLTRALALLLPMLFKLLLYHLCIAVGMLLLIIPGLIVMVSMALFLVVPIAEGGSGWFAVFRSHRLVWRGSWWRTTSVFTVLTVVMLAISIPMHLLVGSAQGFVTLTRGLQPTLFTAVLGAAVAVLLYPLITAVLIAVYNDARVGKEGTDLQTRLGSLI